MDSPEILSLKPSDMTRALEYLIRKREPALLVGAPGIGKSEITTQASNGAGADTLVIHPVLGDPTDGKGMPWVTGDKDYAVFLPFEEAWQIINAKEPLVAFLDDLGQAMPAVQASWMQPVLNRRIAGRPIPDCVSFIAATNRRGDRAGVSGILEPVKGRFTILHLRSDLDDFCMNLFKRGMTDYGLDEETCTGGAAFLRMCKDMLNKFEPTADMTNSPTERNWVAAFRHTMTGLPKQIERALITGRVGEGAATMYVGFLEVYRQMTSIDSILMDVDKAIIPDQPSALFAVAVGLAGRATVQNAWKITRYAERLEENEHGEHAVLLCRDASRKCPGIASTRAWIEMASGPVGKLMTGSED